MTLRLLWETTVAGQRSTEDNGIAMVTACDEDLRCLRGRGRRWARSDRSICWDKWLSLYTERLPFENNEEVLLHCDLREEAAQTKTLPTWRICMDQTKTDALMDKQSGVYALNCSLFLQTPVLAAPPQLHSPRLTVCWHLAKSRWKFLKKIWYLQECIIRKLGFMFGYDLCQHWVFL